MAPPLRVLFPPRKPTTNPYVVMLGEALQAQPDVELVDLTWRNALLGDYDVVHLHWPEILVTGRTPSRRRAKEAAFTALLTRLRVQHKALVRTYHNVDLPSGLTATQERLLLRAEAQTAAWIVLNENGAPRTEAPVVFVPHGHYRDWYRQYERSNLHPGRIGYFGLIRRYKAVDRLVLAFREAAQQRPELSLSIAGKPSTEELAEGLRAAAGDDPRITFTFSFLSEAELVRHITAAQLIALTHREMFNSGTALAALSLDRPVLLPRNDINERLAAEVGADWVLLYDDPLTGDDLLSALSVLDARSEDAAGPDLSARDWDRCGASHVNAYRQAVELARSR